MEFVASPVAPERAMARVLEADRDGVLTAPVEPRMPPEGFVALVTAALTTVGHEPGSVVTRRDAPLELLAVVHDLDRDPTCCEAWVDLAYRAVFAEVARRGLDAIALPLLGTVHGRLAPQRAIALLARACVAAAPRCLVTVCIEHSEPTVPLRLRAETARLRNAGDARG